MKKISLILLLFLLPLCLIPSTSAVYGDESPQSITSFSETLPDDVMFYPDSFGAGIIELADYGEISDESSSPDYILTHIKDGSAFNETTATDIEIWFEVDTTDGFEGFSYAHFLNVDSGTDVDLAAYDFDQDLFVKIDEPVPSSYDWMNGTIYDPDYWNTTHIAFTMYELSGTADLYWDYGEITLHRMTLADSNHYAEGFNDVSDFTILTGGTITSDGDVATHELGTSWQTLYTNNPSFSTMVGLYLEFNVKANKSATGKLYGTKADDNSGGNAFGALSYAITTSWQTYRSYIPSITGYSAGALECLTFTSSTSNVAINYDYFRISFANETGWQHDGSTTEATHTNIGYSDISSDEDILTFESKAQTSPITMAIKIDFDTSATEIDLEGDYYPFVEMYYRIPFSNLTTAPYVTFRVDGTGYSYSSNSLIEDGSWHTWRANWNVQGGSSADKEFDVFCNAANTGEMITLEIDYVKVYSIANYSYWGVVVETDDFSYVESGELVFELDGYPEYILWGRDPLLTVDTNTYTVWNLTIADDDPTGAIDYNINFYIPADDPPTFNDVTRGDLNRGTLTDFTFSVYMSNTISAIKFIDTRDWQDIGEVEFIIPIGWSEEFQFGYDSFFIFLGLIMIPASTMYLVRGGRKEMSSAKLFYGLIIFAVGFGLLVGGIMP